MSCVIKQHAISGRNSDPDTPAGNGGIRAAMWEITSIMHEYLMQITRFWWMHFILMDGQLFTLPAFLSDQKIKYLNSASKVFRIDDFPCFDVDVGVADMRDVYRCISISRLIFIVCYIQIQCYLAYMYICNEMNRSVGHLCARVG